MTLDEAKLFLRIDGTDEDALVTSLMAAAQQYITNATGYQFDDPAQTSLSNLAIQILVMHWYENREPVGQVNELAFSLKSIMTQLQYCNATAIASLTSTTTGTTTV